MDRNFSSPFPLHNGLSPAVLLRRAHGFKLDLCHALERIADNLPDNIDRMECLRIANILAPAIRQIHACEEKDIFPAYAAALAVSSDADMETLRRLKAEHVEDQCFADEVTDTLLGIGHGRGIDNAEAVGFMLRGLFETMRRHIAFERAHILPILDR
ncbi:hemerythrin domain-containing protein [Nitratireductor sp. CAU 1489]|uniref:Hemerythrin domain-containing protein n=1 Tax=Nitratireductor arenosus TaxID=2682096 RepID=A0A844QI87_9HYPH|nr:hemerythrin domain-containing protein [Nitratireductor arenosus]MVA97429.1 hemerythrin domain-containing protein [Nitratireductor arenosus]